MNNCGKGICESSENSIQYNIISSIFIILVLSIVFFYILKLEKYDNECSRHWIRDAIKYITIVLIILSFILKLFIQTNNKYTVSAYLLTFLFYITISVIYYFKLKCNNIKNWGKYILLLPLSIPLFLIILVKLKI